MPATAAAARRAALRSQAASPARVTRPAPRPATRPARRPPSTPGRRSRPRAAPARRGLLPGAVGRAAAAVARLADSAPVLRLTRGRLWIGLLTALLVGIVALNVLALSLSASSTRVGQQADALDRQNSALRARIASGLSTNRLQRTAEKLGFVVPEPGLVRYLAPHDDDAAVAAERLASGAVTFTGVSAPATSVPTAALASATTAPEATAPAVGTAP